MQSEDSAEHCEREQKGRSARLSCDSGNRDSRKSACIHFFDKDKSNPSRVDSFGWAPFTESAFYGRLDHLKKFLDHSPIEDMQMTQAFHLATYAGQESVVEALLATNRVDVNAINVAGESGLTIAAHLGFHDILALIAETGGADVNIRDSGGSTPLILSAEVGNLDAVAYLTSRPDVLLDAEDGGGETAVTRSARKGRGPVCEYLLLNTSASLDPHTATSLQHVAAELCLPRVVDILLDRGIRNTEVRDDAGRTPLLVAASSNCSDVIRLLLSDRGNADANAVDREGRSALVVAVMAGNVAVVEAISESGKADVNLQDDCNRTAFHEAGGLHDDVVGERLLRTLLQASNLRL